MSWSWWLELQLAVCGCMRIGEVGCGWGSENIGVFLLAGEWMGDAGRVAGGVDVREA